MARYQTAPGGMECARGDCRQFILTLSRAQRVTVCPFGIRLSRPRSSGRLVEQPSDPPPFRESQQEHARQPQQQQRVSGRVGDASGISPMTGMPGITVSGSVSGESEPGSGSSASRVEDEGARRPGRPMQRLPRPGFFILSCAVIGSRYVRSACPGSVKIVVSPVGCDPRDAGSLLVQRLARLRPGVNELAALSDHDRTRDSLLRHRAD